MSKSTSWKVKAVAVAVTTPTAGVEGIAAVVAASVPFAAVEGRAAAVTASDLGR